jgi:hypothetical protein
MTTWQSNINIGIPSFILLQLLHWMWTLFLCFVKWFMAIYFYAGRRGGKHFKLGEKRYAIFPDWCLVGLMASLTVLTLKCILISTSILLEKFIFHLWWYNILHYLSISEVSGTKRKSQSFRDEDHYISSVPQNQVRREISFTFVTTRDLY